MQLFLLIFWIGEFILIVLWLIVLFFAFDLDCPADPIDAKPWLLTGAFTQLIGDLVNSLIALVLKQFCYDWDQSFFYSGILVLNLFQSVWFAMGIKVLLSLDCSDLWVIILAEVILGIAILRIPKIVFLFLASKE